MSTFAVKESKDLQSLEKQLFNHILYSAIRTEQHLQIFMQHHVFAVWDFMSLIKAVQNLIAPTSIPWVPSKNPQFVNFINQLVIEEESDASYPTADNVPKSHFERYLDAMDEIGANTYIISRFINTLRNHGLETALEIPNIPTASREFMNFTFEIINSQQPHLIIAVLALGRENLVPQLFRSLQRNFLVDKNKTPNLYTYLDHHIQLDEQQHGPIATKLLAEVCAESSIKHTEAIEVAEKALVARLNFWDGIQQAIK